MCRTTHAKRQRDLRTWEKTLALPRFISTLFPEPQRRDNETSAAHYPHRTLGDARYTFEVTIYEDNKAICDEIFKPTSRTVQDFMLANKSRVAYELLDKKADELVAPDYINEAITWINE